ncbi:LysR substrate-binding domain-containing protein [Amycolatopsis cihanbeyliensis]|uniref:DNA-binding transcriptional LysR family regulator n=1 Tax=Amycolatopsis cihanbeyliensis TaxID=1128664 RepID=A0A542DPX6_AMYCI|nr:LysR substrate-binding domain-containing protein [Amycolatopsis cihanbeyliensis]TQJ05116.1 DNA-binding transcriptional LysR family regulator [Amycolatopsis cihanbeyliensis]
MYHDLQINRLRALMTVVDLGGFRRAAEALHVTQPAVSQQIRQLGGLIKGPIFLSTGRELQLSSRGEELLGYARRIVALNDEAVDRFVPPAGTIRLSIGVGDQLAETLPDILAMLAKGVPNAQVSVRTGMSESLEAQVVAGRLDLALLLQHRSQVGTAMSHELGRMRMDWFGQPSYGDGAELPLTLFTEPCSLRSRILETFDASDLPWRVGYEGAELVGLRAATKAGLGVTCLVANGDELWGLPRTKLELPEPPGPLPVTMALSAGASAPGFVRVAKRALQNALHGYPFAD